LISVIIPTRNRNDFLGACLERLNPGAQSVSIDNYEVIVSDDSSDNISKEFVESKYSWVRWIEGPKKGPASNRNNGAKHAEGEWLVFIDDDCIPDADIIQAYLQGINEHKEILVFEGYISVDRAQRSFLEESPINTTGGYLWSCNFMISRQLFIDALNGFDECYPYASMEDVDLHYRLKKINQSIIFLPAASVIHPWRLQQRPFKTGLRRFSSLQYFLNKFPEKRKEYNAIYFFKAFVNNSKGIFRNSRRFQFHGFSKSIIVALMQLYYAIRVSL